jgi:hypothetical protein
MSGDKAKGPHQAADVAAETVKAWVAEAAARQMAGGGSHGRLLPELRLECLRLAVGVVNGPHGGHTEMPVSEWVATLARRFEALLTRAPGEVEAAPAVLRVAGKLRAEIDAYNNNYATGDLRDVLEEAARVLERGAPERAAAPWAGNDTPLPGGLLEAEEQLVLATWAERARKSDAEDTHYIPTPSLRALVRLAQREVVGMELSTQELKRVRIAREVVTETLRRDEAVTCAPSFVGELLDIIDRLTGSASG